MFLRRGSPAGRRCHKIKIQEIDKLYGPVVMTNGGICSQYDMPQYPPIVPAMRHVHTEQAAEASLLIGPWRGIVLDRSQGEMLGNSTSQRERRRRTERLPWGAAEDPAECQICRGHQIPIGQELNVTDTEQQ